MKKISIFVVVLFICSVTSVLALAGEAKDNYLLLRCEAGRTEDGDSFHGTFNVIENNSLESWALGAKIVTGEKGFKLINPHVFYKLGKGFQVGAKYSTDSFDNELAGPAIRFVRPIGKVFVSLDAAQLFDTKSDNDKTDIWLYLSTAKTQGWYYGIESWYYNIKNGIENLCFRPAKVGYRFKNGLGPFTMIQCRWVDGDYFSDSVFLGLEIRF